MKAVAVVSALALVAVVACSAPVRAQATCAWGSYDLSSLLGQTFSLTNAADGNDYQFSPCSDGVACGTGTARGSLNQFGMVPKQCVHVMAHWNGPQFAELDPANPGAGISVTFGNGDSCFANGVTSPRQLIINMPCAPDDAGTLSAITQSPTCTWTATFSSAASCMPSSSGGGKKLSGGSIFVILFFVVAAAYTLFGCIFNRVAKGTTTARESCPNSEFWTALPGLVGAGCSFVWSKLTCSGGSSASYDNMK